LHVNSNIISVLTINSLITHNVRSQYTRKIRRKSSEVSTSNKNVYLGKNGNTKQTGQFNYLILNVLTSDTILYINCSFNKFLSNKNLSVWTALSDSWAQKVGQNE